MMKQKPGERDHRRHPCQSAEEKIERNLPRPHRRFDYRLSIITGFSWDWTADHIYSATGRNALLPRLLAQFFEPLFGW